MIVVDIIVEGIDIYGLVKMRKECMVKVYEFFEIVGFNKEYVNCYLYEFSGG